MAICDGSFQTHIQNCSFRPTGFFIRRGFTIKGKDYTYICIHLSRQSDHFSFSYSYVNKETHMYMCI